MYLLDKFCCICLTKDNIFNLSDQDSDGISHVDKLTLFVAGMDFGAMSDVRSICGECCTTLNTVYNFQQKCLRSKTNLLTYLSQLQTFSKVRGALSVRLTDIHQQMEAENQSAKNGTTFSNLELEDFHRTGCVLNNHIKKEYDRDENNHIVNKTNNFETILSIDIKEERVENVNMDYCNENSTEYLSSIVEYRHNDMEQEQSAAKRNVIRDSFGNLDEANENIDCKNEIDIEEHLLCEVKEEPTSDTETPQDGSSQGYENAEDIKISKVNPGAQFKEQNTAIILYECSECDKTFNKKWNHTRHMKTHTKLFECELCKRRFSTNTILTRHIQSHSDERPYECDICKKTFAINDFLTSHMRSHTGSRPYECEVCKKRFIRNGHLECHMRSHTGERPYECEICKKTFIEKPTLHLHMRLHTGEQLHECEICNKKFCQKAKLHIHTRIHTGEKPYECEICQKRFIEKAKLHIHMRIHTGEKPYKCEICEKQFSQKHNLQLHIRLHTDERPHECEICPKKFIRKYDLFTHMRNHTGERPYECDVCKKTFVRNSTLQSHMRVLHAQLNVIS